MRKARFNVVVDASWLTDSGTGRYAREVINGLRLEPQLGIHLTRRRRPAHPLAPLTLAGEVRHADVFWSPQYMAPLTGPPAVITLHDLLQVRYASWPKRCYFNFILRQLYRRNTTIVTVSQFSRNEILNWSGLPAERVLAVPNGVSENFSEIGGKYEPGYNYLLYIGNRRTHKNLPRLFHAFAKSRASADLHLVLSGSPELKLVDLSRRFGITRRVHFLGQIEEQFLPLIYRGAAAVIYISLYEGFGLPTLEAMACGVPVLASNVAAIPEVVGDAAYIVDPYDVNAIAYAIDEIVTDSALRERLVTAGFRRAGQFHWDKTVGGVLSALRTVAEYEMQS